MDCDKVEKNQCVLCGLEGHIGKNCKEIVCILCCAKGHLMEQCSEQQHITSDLPNNSDNGGKASISVESSATTKTTIRLKNLNDLMVHSDASTLSINSSSSKSDPSPGERSSKVNSQNEYEEKKFARLMDKKFASYVPSDVIELFKKKYCGLCCIKFSGDDFARKHYEGRGHETLIRKKTYTNRPRFWQMIFHALITVDPKGATEEEIFGYIVETFSAHINENRKHVRAEMIHTINEMVDRFNNVVVKNGVYKLRDRNPKDIFKSTSSYDREKERTERDQSKSWYDSDKRRHSGRYDENSHHKKEREYVGSELRYERDDKQYSMKNHRNKERYESSRSRRYSRRSRSRSPHNLRKSYHEKPRSKYEDKSTSNVQNREHTRRSCTPQRSPKCASKLIDEPVVTTDIRAPQVPISPTTPPTMMQVMTMPTYTSASIPGYQLPFFTLTPENMSSLFSGYFLAPQQQQQQTIITPPPTPE